MQLNSSTQFCYDLCFQLSNFDPVILLRNFISNWVIFQDLHFNNLVKPVFAINLTLYPALDDDLQPA